MPMLDCVTLVFCILIGWLVSGVMLAIAKVRMRGKLPRGAVLVERQPNIAKDVAPGTRWSRLGVVFGIGVDSAAVFSMVVLCLTTLWADMAPYLSVDFPVWLNGIGIAGMWVQDAWGTLVMIYNPNYTNLYKPIKGKYALATGGPYHIIRHPMYVGKVIQTIFILFATGMWFVVLGFVTVVFLPRQARYEEEFLQERFGSHYTDYANQTGQFFPRLRMKNRELTFRE